MKAGKVLAICCRPENHDDFVAIGKRIIRKAPEIAVVIKPITYHTNELDPALQHFPLLNLYLVNPPKVIPARGKTLHVKRIDKFEQYQRYVLANISTPKTIEYEIGQEIDINEWGEYIFLKSRNSSYSENSFLIPTKYILDIEPYFKKLGLSNKMLLQRFIYSGKSANHYRVLNFLGEPLFCAKVNNPYPIKLPSSLDEAFNNNTTQTSRRDVILPRTLEFNKEVLNFSQKVYNVFQDQPLQGIDIIVEESTNKLFVLEGNQGGNIWSFSHKTSPMLTFLGRKALLTQFNAFDVACDVLIKKTHELAA
jgi:hypothetical protein